MSNAIETKWTKKIKGTLIGRTIKDVQYMDADNAKDMMWCKRPLLIVLDNDTIIYPMMDDEGNDGGAMGTNLPELPVIPVMR